MNVKNCRKCKRIFNYVMGPVLCPRCREEEEEKFQEVKKYVIENPGSGIQEVSEACDVSVNLIRQWLREERLVLSDESPMQHSSPLKRPATMMLTLALCVPT